MTRKPPRVPAGLPPGPSPGTSGPSRPIGDIESQQPAAAQENPDELYPNYSTTIIRLVLQSAPCVFLFLLWAPAPTKATAIIAVGEEFIGAFRKCTGGVCEDWLHIGAAGAAVSPAEAPPASANSNGSKQLVRRAGTLSESLDPSTFYLNTGLAILSAFYISLYLVIFIGIRLMRKPSPEVPEPDPDPPEHPDSKKKKKKRVKGTRRRNTKIFAYRASRCMGVVNTVLLFGCLVGSGKAVWDVRSEMELQGSDGIGGGLFLLLVSLLITLYLTLRDLAAPDGRIQHWLTLRQCLPGKKLDKAEKAAVNTKGVKGAGQGSGINTRK